MRRRPLLAFALLGVLVLAAAGCGSSGSSSAKPGAVDVVVTTTQLGDVVRAIGGDAVDVHQILKPNTDPHDYEPRPKDIQATAGAKLVVTSGDELDAWMGDVIENAGGDPTVLDAGAGRPVALPGETSGPEASRFDPHWWHDPRNVEYAATRIRDALARAAPAKTAEIDTGATRYLDRLTALDAGIARCMDAVPAAQRKLVTDHDAFNYFARRYGIDVVGAVIPSQTTQAQPSAGDLADLTRTIEREHVKAIFPESSINPKLADAIARETGASSDLTLYGDTLGAADSAGATYVRMEAANADAIVRGLTGGAQRCRIAGL
ncbi:Manganese-binding lipoprotein MntA [Baekduia alba]|uniref:metal ABC transporter substrate-binding protein n=1 Tax=Baekduia alba TaxID=2997333 RepID=UPI002340178A|nr:metal ABC transporter substrate-binding protein [Baekduia alba]WCB92207.1 Manganese-binding lipoprotein MntA [Baekduia alba]